MTGLTLPSYMLPRAPARVAEADRLTELALAARSASTDGRDLAACRRLTGQADPTGSPSPEAFGAIGLKPCVSRYSRVSGERGIQRDAGPAAVGLFCAASARNANRASMASLGRGLEQRDPDRALRRWPSVGRRNVGAKPPSTTNHPNTSATPQQCSRCWRQTDGNPSCCRFYLLFLGRTARPSPYAFRPRSRKTSSTGTRPRDTNSN